MKFQAALCIVALVSKTSGAIIASSPSDAPDAPDAQAASDCVKQAAQFMTHVPDKQTAVVQATNFCKKVGSQGCGHFTEILTRAFEGEADGKTYTPESFCQVTETYVAELQAAPRVPSVGSGSLTNFQLSPTCAKAVGAAFKPHTGLGSEHMAEFWYSMCLNQDCAHFLQSRTRWCKLSRQPTHSARVCDGVRRFVKDEIQVHDGSEITPEKACDLYAEFVKEMAEDVEAYESVMQPSSEVALLSRGGPALAHWMHSGAKDASMVLAPSLALAAAAALA